MYLRTLVVFYVITSENMDPLFDIVSVSTIDKRKKWLYIRHFHEGIYSFQSGECCERQTLTQSLLVIFFFLLRRRIFCFSILTRISVVFDWDYVCVNMWRSLSLGSHHLSNDMSWYCFLLCIFCWSLRTKHATVSSYVESLVVFSCLLPSTVWICWQFK